MLSHRDFNNSKFKNYVESISPNPSPSLSYLISQDKALKGQKGCKLSAQNYMQRLLRIQRKQQTKQRSENCKLGSLENEGSYNITCV